MSEEKPRNIFDLMDRIAGTETRLSIGLDDVGLAMGNRNLVSTTGNVKLSLSLLK